jgi:drug/metabolite transporter (DMT)-like permease
VSSHLSLALALALALASAGALNWGYFAQHGVAASIPPLSLRQPLRSLTSLFANPRWLFGFLVMIGGWLFYVAALRFGPLSLVQAASAGGIGLLALLVQRVAHVRLAWHEWLGVGLAIGGLALLGISLIGGSKGGSRGDWMVVVSWVLVATAVACLAAGAGRFVLAPGAGLGIAAGLLFAAGDIATKAAVGGGTRLALIPVLFSCQGLGFVWLQLGFQRGSAIATAGVATLFTNSVPIAAGFFVFGEDVPSGAAGALRIAAFAVVIAGAALLARPESISEPPAESV